MSNQASAGRYAKALLDVTIREADPVVAEQELTTFAELFEKHDDLRRALTNPAVPVHAKRAVMTELLGRVSPTSKPLAKLLMMLTDRDRLELMPDLLRGYRERLMDYQQVVRAEVTTALPLAADHAGQLQERLARVTGRTVRMTTRVDPSILGGVVARVGSTVYDGSVATQLQRMKDRLTESV